MLLERRSLSGWTPVAEGVTGSDGKLLELESYAGPGGSFRLTVAPAPYFASLGMPASHSEVAIAFQLSAEQEDRRISVFIAPNAYTSFVRH
jgi:5-hydroxyisourate hydrolase-like protein (transthyretin family)